VRADILRADGERVHVAELARQCYRQVHSKDDRWSLRKAVPLEGPAIVRKGAAKPETPPAPANDDRKPAIVAIIDKKHVAQADRPLTVRVGSDVAPPSSG
jgi:hypothetical protein